MNDAVAAASRTGSLDAWLERLFADPDLVRMGHNQRLADRNLGLGWIYYGLARLYRPRLAVVIGSWRGFVPMVIARGCQDNADGGQVLFIDPSLVDDFWRDPARVEAWFGRFGLDNIRHRLATTQDFAASPEHAALGPVDLLFVDGLHTAEQARFDYEAFRGRLSPRSIVLFHDSMRDEESRMYGVDKGYAVTVRQLMEEYRSDPALQVFDLPFGTGLTLLRRPTGPAEQPLDESPRRRRPATPGA
jgi:predicted O-methyltransferase YrrM